MRRALALLLTTFLAGCVVPTPPSVPSNAGTTTKDDPTLGGLCKVGPDGGPLLADRGIGGTGIGVSGAGGIGGTGEPMRLAERGIGGTGLRPDDLKGPTRGVRPTEILQPTEIAQRTTGIVGVITGFASICVDGLDIAVDHTVPIDIEGKPGDPNALRAGQVVAIEATGPTGALRAKGIAVRHEVAGDVADSGPLEHGHERLEQRPEVPPIAATVPTGIAPPGHDDVTLEFAGPIHGGRGNYRSDDAIIAAELGEGQGGCVEFSVGRWAQAAVRVVFEPNRASIERGNLNAPAGAGESRRTDIGFETRA